MKWLCSLLLLLIPTICTSAETPTLTTNPVAAVKAVLPRGWVILKVEDNTYPSYRPRGKGTAMFLGISAKRYRKQECSAVLYIMPKDYEDGGVDPTHGQAQSPPARLIATATDGKVYLWPPNGRAEGWTTMLEDLLKALAGTGESGRGVLTH